MNENIKNETLKTELPEGELKKVSGGGITTDPYDDRSRFMPVVVRDGDNNSALCPFCTDTALEYDEYTTIWDSAWNFSCPRCNKKFVKVKHNGAWYEVL